MKITPRMPGVYEQRSTEVVLSQVKYSLRERHGFIWGQVVAMLVVLYMGHMLP